MVVARLIAAVTFLALTLAGCRRPEETRLPADLGPDRVREDDDPTNFARIFGTAPPDGSIATAGALAAYDRATGEAHYSSPQLFRLDGVEQILFTSEVGVTPFAATDGATLWQHAWSGDPIVQPAQTEDGDVLLSVSVMGGVRRLAVATDGGTWTVEPRWTSHRLKP